MSGIVTRLLAQVATHPLCTLLLLLYAIVVVLPAQLKPTTPLIKKTQKCENRAKEEALRRSSESARTCERRKHEDGKGPARAREEAVGKAPPSLLFLSHDTTKRNMMVATPSSKAELLGSEQRLQVFSPSTTGTSIGHHAGITWTEPSGLERCEAGAGWCKAEQRLGGQSGVDVEAGGTTLAWGNIATGDRASGRDRAKCRWANPVNSLERRGSKSKEYIIYLRMALLPARERSSSKNGMHLLRSLNQTPPKPSVCPCIHRYVSYSHTLPATLSS
jgi:hypothetical protein